MTTPLSLTVIGAGGLLIGEALRLVEMHPMLKLCRAVTRAPGTSLLELQPHLSCGRDLKTIDLHAATCDLRRELADEDARAVLLLGLPHAETAKTWRVIREELGDAADRLVVVDLSADYRLRDLTDYTRWYGEHADPSELPNFRYGLPELNGAELRGEHGHAARRQQLHLGRNKAALGRLAIRIQHFVLLASRQRRMRADAAAFAAGRDRPRQESV